MKIRYITFFAAAFLICFVVLNGRFIYANVGYWFNQGTLPVNNNAPLPSSLPISQAKARQPLPDGATLVIDKIGVSAPIIFGVSNDATKILSNLAYGVVHDTGTPKPGEGGVSVILGHSSAYLWYRGHYGSVFALLGKLEPGDRFYVRYNDGRVFTYSVRQSIIFIPLQSDDRLTQVEQSKTNSLVLVSCWPVGTNYKRIAVQAELI
jgi:LPXTG-site transpeptidase (sortase) family protein